MIAILAATFLLGFFLDWIELTLIILPLVSPVVVTLGFDPVWFTVLFAVCLQTSFLTPPVGFAIFYLKGVSPEGIEVGTIYKGVIPFVSPDRWRKMLADGELNAVFTEIVEMGTDSPEDMAFLSDKRVLISAWEDIAR